MRPVRNAVYTTAQLFDLDLQDSPHMGFSLGNERHVIQESHCTVDQLLAVPGLTDVRWRYLRTTDEWIPVFQCVDTQQLMQCVDITFYSDLLYRREEAWVVPVGCPRDLATECFSHSV